MNSGQKVTLVLPYFNEAQFIAGTLESLARQRDRRFGLILVDNASTDQSTRIVRETCAMILPDIAVSFVEEMRPGKIFALQRGMGQADANYVGTIDADTIYPPDYVGNAIRLLESKNAPAAALAFGLEDQTQEMASFRLRLYSALFPTKSHTGGFGQFFDRLRLEECGGFDSGLWPYVLEDHEIIHRIAKHGSIAYASDFVCYPSDRPTDREKRTWTLFERILYKLLPVKMMDWFFYRFLALRFERRGLSNVKLRERAWEANGAVD